MWLIKQHPILKTTSCKISWDYKNSVSSIRNKSYWNFNNLNAKDPHNGLFSQKELLSAITRAQKEWKKKKERENQIARLIFLAKLQTNIILNVN